VQDNIIVFIHVVSAAANTCCFNPLNPTGRLSGLFYRCIYLKSR